MEAAESRGIPLPEWAKNEPQLPDGDEFYLAAFSELSTCRPFGMTLGPIPWRDIVLYADYHELDSMNRQFFARAMRQLDTAYLTWQKGKKPKKNG